jgi:hypothetical protein
MSHSAQETFHADGGKPRTAITSFLKGVIHSLAEGRFPA